MSIKYKTRYIWLWLTFKYLVNTEHRDRSNMHVCLITKIWYDNSLFTIIEFIVINLIILRVAANIKQ